MSLASVEAARNSSIVTERKVEVIYISGPMTGYPNFNREAFVKAEMNLIGKGKEIVSPSLTEQDDEGMPWKPLRGKWEYYFKIALIKMLHCNAIVMLDGWRYSLGARIERFLAKILKYKIYESIEEVV